MPKPFETQPAGAAFELEPVTSAVDIAPATCPFDAGGRVPVESFYLFDDLDALVDGDDALIDSP